MLGFITKLFGGNKSEKDVADARPLVAQANAEYEKLKSLSHDELRRKTAEFKEQIKNFLSAIDEEMDALKVKAENDETDFDAKEELYKEIDALEKKRDEQLEIILLELLPAAFAVMKETAFRFSNNKTISSTATPLDRELAAKKDFIKIEGDTAVYSNTWNVIGQPITWNMVHYDVQLIGGIVLHNGKIAEMATGEGKTLVATLPCYLNSLAGLGVNVVTVNDYLARRDSEWNAPLFNFLGLTIDCIDKHQPHSPERRSAYLADITYGTNNEFGFDYLRDNMVRSKDELVQRKHHYAMVDEVDSVLIDDARTPLIISGPIPKGDDQQFHIMKPRIQKIVEAQKKVVNQFLNDAKKQIEAGKSGPKDGGLSLLRAHRGLPKYGNLIRFLSEENHKTILQKTENNYLADNQKEMPFVDSELYFTIDEKHNQVDLTDKGIELITEAGEDKQFFILPEVGSEVAEIERTAATPEEKVERKDKLMADFSIKSERIHTVQQLLKAYTLFDKDVEYVVMDGKVKIVDEQTGRILDGRRYSDGLHQAIEAKENVKVEDATQTYATITLQNYFRMYHKLCGMTGTAETEAGEFWEIYKLDVVVVPTNKPMTRKDFQDVVYRTRKEKYKAVIDEIEALQKVGRPVLVGTTSVEVSELLSRMLKMKGIKHNVLNAKQHQREAEIVAEAGKTSNVTIATNMAGRGTDIKLGPGVVEAGGLAIIGTERHEARRVDRQLRGRAGRQGDPGTTKFFVALEDDLMRLFGSDRLAGWMGKMGYKEGDALEHSMLTKSIERAQKKVEENNFGTRKHLIEYDDVMNVQRDVIYKKRHHALFGERLKFDLYNTFYDLCSELVTTNQATGSYENFKLDCLRFLAMDIEISEEEFKAMDETVLAGKLYDAAMDFYKRKSQHLTEHLLPILKNIRENKGEGIENVVAPFTDGTRGLNVLIPLKSALATNGKDIMTSFEKNVTLQIIDDTWKEHLREMDELKSSVQNARYEQKDPLLIYKFEAFELFKKMMIEVNRDVTSFLFKGGLPQQNPNVGAAQKQRSDFSRMRESKQDAESGLRGAPQQNGNGEQMQQEPQQKMEPVRVGPKVGRNDPCPCGSGKKFKNCHGKE